MADDYDRKYGIDSSDEAIEEFHSKRRMFAIKDSSLHVAPENVTSTHAVWFENLGWITPEDDTMMETLTRGYVDIEGIYFYKGYDFQLDVASETEMLRHLEELVETLSVPKHLHLMGGIIRQSSPGKWPSRKDYGTIESLLKED